MKRSGNKRRHTDGHSDLQDDSLEEKKQTSKQTNGDVSFNIHDYLDQSTDQLVSA